MQHSAQTSHNSSPSPYRHPIQNLAPNLCPILKDFGFRPLFLHQLTLIRHLSVLSLSRPHTTETGWNDLSGGSAEEGSSRVMLSPFLAFPTIQTKNSLNPT